MSNEKRSASNSIRVMLVGVVLTDVRVSETTNGKACANFMLSGEDGLSYWVRTFNERLIGSLQKNVGKKSVLSVVGEVVGVNEANGDYKCTLAVNAKSIDFIANFGENRNSEPKEKNEKWGSQQQSNQQQQQQQQQQQAANNEPPMDFDDDIPF